MTPKTSRRVVWWTVMVCSIAIVLFLVFWGSQQLGQFGIAF